MRRTEIGWSVPALGYLLAGLLWNQGVASEPDANRVEITLNATASIGDRLVRLGDIADLQGGRTVLRERIQRIDIADAPLADATEIISRRRIEIRLLLAGVDRDEFVVTGAPLAFVVRKDEGLTDAKVLDAIRAALSRQLSIDAQDLELRLVQPVYQKPVTLQDSADIELRPYLPLNPQVGRLRVKVGVLKDDKLLHTISVVLDLVIYKELPRTLRSVARGDVFSKDDVEFVRTAVSRQELQSAAPEVLGHRAKRNMQRRQFIRASDIDLSSLAENAVLIKPRDVVRMVARKRGLTVVVPAGEALQQGRLGELIRVRNPQSKKIVIGRVLSRGEVEVPL